MTRRAEMERFALEALRECKGPSPKRARCAEGAALLKPLAKRAGSTEEDVAKLLDNHAALELRSVQATRLFGLFRRTRASQGVAVRTSEGVREALARGAAAPDDPALLARCVGALCAGEPGEGARDFEGVLPGPKLGPRALSPLALTGAERVEASSQGAGADVARSRSELARLRKFAIGTGYEFNERLRVNSAMAAVEAVLQAPPEVLERALKTETFERWMRDDVKERELADILTATRLRAAAEGLSAADAKRLLIRLLSFSPMREALTSGLVPSFVAKLTTAPEREVIEIARVLEGLGSESVLEALIKAVYEVPPDARPRVLMALGSTGSLRVLDPLERLAMHSKVKADRLEAAAAIVRIAQRSPGARAKKALQRLAESEDPEVKALLPSEAPLDPR